jgi:hypothetical protein
MSQPLNDFSVITSVIMIDRFVIGVSRAREPSRRPACLVAAMALGASISAFSGCSGGGTAVGEGTIDLRRAKEGSSSNLDIAKAAAARGKGVIGDTARKTGRK